MRGKVKHILFLCTGNICRSPFAEWLFRKLVDDKGLVDIHGDSAGVMALPGNCATSMAQKVAREHDVDLSEHRAKPTTQRLVDWADIVLVMEKSHERDLLSDFPQAAGKILLLRYFARSGSRNRGIADPYGLKYEAYRFCFLDIQESVSGLVAYLEGETRAFTPVQVTCYEGYKANESPRFFSLNDRKHEVSHILDRWYDGAAESSGGMADYYKVEDRAGKIFILRYNRQKDIWGVLACEGYDPVAPQS